MVAAFFRFFCLLAIHLNVNWKGYAVVRESDEYFFTSSTESVPILQFQFINFFFLNVDEEGNMNLLIGNCELNIFHYKFVDFAAMSTRIVFIFIFPWPLKPSAIYT